MTLNFTVKKDALYHIWALAKAELSDKVRICIAEQGR